MNVEQTAPPTQELEDWLTEAIDDSLGPDWTGRMAARCIVDRLDDLDAIGFTLLPHTGDLPMTDVNHPTQTLAEGDELKTDERPFAEPDFFSFRELDGRDVNTIAHELLGVWKTAGEPVPEEGRWTIINDDYPNPPYPNGVYFEGWSIAPYRMDPPHRAAPFNFPLTYSQEPHNDQ